MTKIQNIKHYDPEERTFVFARDNRKFVKQLPRSIVNLEDGPQFIRSSGSVGSNYIEANESLSRKDFLVRIKICRKEAKESAYWLRLVDTNNDRILEEERLRLLQEAKELSKIFGSIVTKSE